MSQIWVHYFFNQDDCKKRARELEKRYIKTLSWPDQPFSFIMGNDGLIYEGRGWMKDGSISSLNGDKLLSIVFLADHNYYKPSNEQQELLKQLINYGIKLGHIAHNYFIYAQCQSKKTNQFKNSPGKVLYDMITESPRWSDYSDNRELENCTFNENQLMS